MRLGSFVEPIRRPCTLWARVFAIDESSAPSHLFSGNHLQRCQLRSTRSGESWGRLVGCHDPTIPRRRASPWELAGCPPEVAISDRLQRVHKVPSTRSGSLQDDVGPSHWLECGFVPPSLDAQRDSWGKETPCLDRVGRSQDAPVGSYTCHWPDLAIELGQSCRRRSGKSKLSISRRKYIAMLHPPTLIFHPTRPLSASTRSQTPQPISTES